MKIGKDKLMHSYYSFFGGMILSLIAIQFTDKFAGSLIGFLLMLAIGLGKEFIWDKLMKKGQFEWLDILFDFIGCLLAFLLMISLYH